MNLLRVMWALQTLEGNDNDRAVFLFLFVSLTSVSFSTPHSILSLSFPNPTLTFSALTSIHNASVRSASRSFHILHTHIIRPHLSTLTVTTMSDSGWLRRCPRISSPRWQPCRPSPPTTPMLMPRPHRTHSTAQMLAVVLSVQVSCPRALIMAAVIMVMVQVIVVVVVVAHTPPRRGGVAAHLVVLVALATVRYHLERVLLARR